MFISETKKETMKFEIFDYDLQVEGSYGEYQWMFNCGNVWIYKDKEKNGYRYRTEVNIQIEPFSSEKEIEYAIESAFRNGNWKTTKRKIEKPTAMQILWASKLLEEVNKKCLFDVLNVERK